MSTTLHGVTQPTPAPATAPPHDAAAPRDPWRRRLTWIGDAAALVPIVVAVVGLAGSDGGRGLVGTWPLAVAAGVALPAVVGEVRRLPRVAVWALGAWLVALVLGVVAAADREHMVVPLLQYALAPVLVLAARRLWSRSWAPPVLLVLLVIGFGRYQSRAWSVWWARAESGQGLWAPLSWRNQSAALTGMFGVWFLAAALGSRRLVRGGLGVLAVTGFAGAWLSSSRAGLAVTLAAGVVAVVLGTRSATARGEPAWRPVVTVGIVALATWGLVGALLAMQPTGTDTPLAGRTQTVEQNTTVRVAYVEAGLGMLADRPVTGQGLGSYRGQARRWFPPDTGLTASAHDEYVEVAGETGLLGVAALLLVLAGSAAIGFRLLRSPPSSSGPDDVRGPLVVGGVAALALFLVHSGVDFDWDYPVLSSLAAVALGVALPVGASRRTPRPVATAVATALAVVLVAGLALGLVERRPGTPPWDASAHVAAGETALDAGDTAGATGQAEAALRWSPASSAARSLVARITYAQDGDVAALVASTEADPRWFGGRARAALALAEAGDTTAATRMADALHDDLDRFASWGIQGWRLLLGEAEVVVAADTSCDDARSAAADAIAADADGARPLPTDGAEVLAERLAAVGCG